MFDKKRRDTTADLIKGIAVILMIQVHLIELFALQDIYNSGIGKFLLFLGGPPAAPVFMGVMGYFIFHSSKTTRSIMLRGVMLILGGLLLNIGLNFHLLVLIYNGTYQLNPYQYIFGSDILPLAGLSMIIIAFLKKYFMTNVYIFTTAGIIALLFAQILPDIYNDASSPAAYIQAFLWGNLKWSYFPLFPWLFYPIAGYIFGILQDEFKNFFSNQVISYPVLAAAVIVLLFTWNYGYTISSTLEIYYHHNIVFAAWTILFLSVYIFMIHRLNGIFKLSPGILFLRWAGKNVTSFYVFQWLIIGNIATALYKTQNGLQIILWFAAVVIASTLLVLIFNYLKKKRY